jgi:hypothetical protein
VGILPHESHRFQFQERGQLFIRTHSETLSVIAVRIGNEDRVRPLESIAQTQAE